ncbi:MAG: putative Dolichyl-phosphate beta-D-mannosyltransferase [Promethearchaeota archaeon]|nr:MAG: putative Dolichyl-phosphate beta-D-mannosyltransferase [Candidatus Lokiarchaeota archaeon]
MKKFVYSLFVIGLFLISSLLIFSNIFLLPFQNNSNFNLYSNPKKILKTSSELNLNWTYSTGGPIISSPALGDVDGDGKLEIILGSSDNTVYSLNGEDGSVNWTYSTDGPIISSPALGDVDGDGKLEVVIGCNDKKIYVLNGEDGSVNWTYSTGGPILSSPALGDVDGDGKLEIILGSSDNTVYSLNGEDGSVNWTYSTGGPILSSPALGDVDGDGKLEVVIGCNDKKIYVLNGLNGFIKWTYLTGGSVTSSPALGDVDGDGKPEVIAGCDDRNIYVLNGEDGTIRWRCAVFWEIIHEKIFTSPALGDVDSDGRLEVVVGCDDKIIYVLNGEDGTIRWKKLIYWDFYRTNVFSSPALGDVDGDNKLEVVVGCDNGRMYVLNGEDGSIRMNYLTNGPIASSPVFGDLNEDGSLQMIFGSNDNNLYVIQLPSSAKRIYWQGLNGDLGMANSRNLLRNDPDNDFLSTYSEMIYNTDSLKNDSDDDGIPDGWEVSHGLNPLLNDSNEDSDQDRVINYYEYLYRINPNIEDSDYDGFSDWMEIFVYNTNPDSFLSSPLTIINSLKSSSNYFLLWVVILLVFTLFIILFASLGSVHLKLTKKKVKRLTYHQLNKNTTQCNSTVSYRLDDTLPVDELFSINGLITKQINTQKKIIKCSIVIPLYNEEKSIKNVLKNIPNHDYFEIVVVDDGSTDSSIKKVKTVDDPRIKIVSHQKNKGYGAAILSGFQKAKGDIIVTLDSDGQHDPQEIPNLMKPLLLNKADIIIGSRYLGKCNYKVPYYTRLGEYIIKNVLQTLFHQFVGNNQSGFRAFKREHAFLFENIMFRGFGLCTEILFKAGLNRLRVREVPITIASREFGASYVNIIKILYSILLCISIYSLKKIKLYKLIPNTLKSAAKRYLLQL